jgi:hypothetical protein
MSPGIKSYLRHALIALVPLLTVEETQVQHYMFAIAIAVVGPLIRALDPSDHDLGVNSGSEKEN